MKEFSLASRFYQLSFSIEICLAKSKKCFENYEVRGVNSYPVPLWVTKKMTRKTNLIVCYTFSVGISLILYNNWDRSFENCSFMVTKFDRYFV